MGLPEDNFVVWDNNGIEYVYPSKLLAEIFRCAESDLSGLVIADEGVEINGITKRKKELADEVVKHIDAGTELPLELEKKLLGRVSAAIS